MLGERLQLKFFDPGKAKTVTQIKKGIGDSLVFTTRDFNNHDMDKVAEFLHAGEKLKHDRTTPLVSAIQGHQYKNNESGMCPFMDQYQCGVAFTHYMFQFGLSAKPIYTNMQYGYIREKTLTDIEWDKLNSRLSLCSRSCLSLKPDKKAPDKRNPSVKAVTTRDSVWKDEFQYSPSGQVQVQGRSIEVI